MARNSKNTPHLFDESIEHQKYLNISSLKFRTNNLQLFYTSQCSYIRLITWAFIDVSIIVLDTPEC